MIDRAKTIRRAALITKGLERAVGPMPGKDDGERVHPASLIPGVHVQAIEPHTAPDGYADGGDVSADMPEPKRTVKAYKLFKTKKSQPGQLFPLFVNADKPVEMGKWLSAEAGPQGKDPRKVKSTLGDLAYRPGWHSGDLPVATHIGGKSSADSKAPDYRPDHHVWAEVEHPADVDWQAEANSRARTGASGQPIANTAHITDQVPHGGFYRYKTNPNMSGHWLISGGMKVNRVLGDDEVKEINDAHGVADLPRRASGGEVQPTDETGFDAFHGTPHDFPAERLIQHPTGEQEHMPAAQPVPEGAQVMKDMPLGRFRSDKIGTGEGAQAYGHGLYLGEEGTARGYRDRLRSSAADSEYMSGVRRALASFEEDKRKAHDNALLLALTSDSHVQLPEEPMGADAAPNVRAAGRIFSAHDTNEPANKVASNIQAQFPHLRDEGSFLQIGPKRLAIADQVEKMRERTKGHIYHVRVNANPEHFLDWDKPLSEQHPHVQKALGNFGFFVDPGIENPSGRDIHRKLVGGASEFGTTKQGAIETSKELHNAGIPGIRYLDANSRGPTGDPTHNHVIFDPSIIDIKRKYARGGGVGRHGYATDGMVTGTPMDNDPAMQKALDVARQAAPAPVNPLTQPQLIQGPDQALTTKSLADAFTQAITHHSSLPFAQKALNSKRMGNRIAAFVGRGDEGRPKPLLGQNAKLVKASSGYEAGSGYEAQAPLELQDGRGVETTGLSLYPDSQQGKFKLCPNSAACRDACLGKTSGQYAAQYTSKPNYPILNAKNKTKAFFEDPEAFAVRLHDEITQAKLQAQLNGNKLGVRLNTLSDVDPRVHRALIESHPDVDFYDYTKMNYDPIAPNHHYTYSSSGVTQPAGYNGSEETVFNQHGNWNQMRKRLDTGSNVAMVFNHRSQQGIPLPKFVHDEETNKKYQVVDGTTHDFRPLDRQEEGVDGVIIGLQNLQSSGTTENAHKDSKGFIVKYDPKLKMVLNKQGLPTKDALRGESPGVNAAGKPLLGSRIPQNDTVTIAKQPPRTQRVV